MTRAYAWLVGVFLLVQGLSTLAARLVPALDAAVPALLEHTRMVPAHSLLHIATALVALAVLRSGTAKARLRFALGFGLFYVALALAGVATGLALGLGLRPFDHPFHLLLGGLGLLAAALDARRGSGAADRAALGIRAGWPMKAPMAARRAYFLVVLGFTAWVGFFGFFRPQEVLRALPWPVPPLHARVIGALYLSATLFLLLSVLARTRLQVRTVIDIALVWTGWLLAVSILHWRSFDASREQVWFWAVAYVAFPLAAAGLRWSRASLTVPRSALITERWVRVCLAAQGATLVLLALLLALLPDVMASQWPWKISPFLAQIYSGPVLGYGVGSLLMAARRNWTETLIPTIGMAAFALLALLGSSWHIELFSAGSVSQTLWFSGLGLLAALSIVIIAGALRRGSGS